TWYVVFDAANSKLELTAKGETSGATAKYKFTDGTVTAATGGSAISADTNTTNGTVTWTSLTGPVYTEAAPGQANTGNIVLNAPAGFVFDTGGTAPTVKITGDANAANNINNVASGTSQSTTVTSTTITFNVTAKSAGGLANTLTWQNIRVRPT